MASSNSTHPSAVDRAAQAARAFLMSKTLGGLGQLASRTSYAEADIDRRWDAHKERTGSQAQPGAQMLQAFMRSPLMTDTIPAILGQSVEARMVPQGSQGDNNLGFVRPDLDTTIRIDPRAAAGPAIVEWEHPLRNTVLHESGHLFDMALQTNPELSSIIRENFPKARDRLERDGKYAGTNEREYFAEIFVDAVNFMSDNPDVNGGTVRDANGDRKSTPEENRYYRQMYLDYLEDEKPGVVALVNYLRNHPKYSEHPEYKKPTTPNINVYRTRNQSRPRSAAGRPVE